MKRILSIVGWTVLLGLMVSCTATAQSQSGVVTPTNFQTETLAPSQTNAISITATPTEEAVEIPQDTATAVPVEADPAIKPTLGPEDWKSYPVIPEISPEMVKVYQQGVKMGNNPASFSKIGDCESTPTWFLGEFDSKSPTYRLGEYTDLLTVINYYQGSYGRVSLAARRGFKASSVFATIWTDTKLCNSGETPLACEYRIQKPSLALIMLGTNDVDHEDTFEANMRKIIEFTLSKGIVPILSTKADNLEGDGSINRTIVQLAVEYDLPLWNFWKAVQDLPHQGLQEDHEHLTVAPNYFDDRIVMWSAWPVRNLTALQVLQSFWKAVNQ